MRFFIDTEFNEISRHQPTELLSIGLVAANGKTFYAENACVDLSKCDDWLQHNVIKQFTGPKKTPVEIAQGIMEFINSNLDDSYAEFWGYYGATDFVITYQLWDKLISAPANFPFVCHELKTLQKAIWYMTGKLIEIPKQKTPKHHALNDALWHKEIFDHLMKERK